MYSNNDQQRSYDEGFDGKHHSGMGSQQNDAYERGRAGRRGAEQVAETYGKIGEAIHLGSILLRPVFKFVVMQGAFLLAGFITTYAIAFIGFSFAPNDKTSLAICFALVTLVSAYFYYCGYQALRARMINGRNYNGTWRRYYVMAYLVEVIIPAFWGCGIVFCIFGGAFLNDFPFITFERISNHFWLIPLDVFFFVVIIWKIHRQIDLLDDHGTPKIAKWAFNKGKKVTIKPKTRQVKEWCNPVAFVIFTLMLSYILCLVFFEIQGYAFGVFFSFLRESETLTLLFVCYCLGLWLAYKYAVWLFDFFFNYSIDYHLPFKGIWPVVLIALIINIVTIIVSYHFDYQPFLYSYLLTAPLISSVVLSVSLLLKINKRLA